MGEVVKAFERRSGGVGERRAYGLVALGCSGYNGSGLRRGLEQATAEDSGGIEADLTACGSEESRA